MLPWQCLISSEMRETLPGKVLESSLEEPAPVPRYVLFLMLYVMAGLCINNLPEIYFVLCYIYCYIDFI